MRVEEARWTPACWWPLLTRPSSGRRCRTRLWPRSTRNNPSIQSNLRVMWGRRRRRRRRYSPCSRSSADFAWRSGCEGGGKKRRRQEGQIEVEKRSELNERRTCTWMTSDETQTWGACEMTSKSARLRSCSGAVHVARVHVIVLVVDVVCLMLVLIARVAFP